MIGPVWHALRLMRAHSALGAALAVAVGGSLSGAELDYTWLAPMALAFLLAAAGNVDNDVQDVAIDRQNRPRRPLPAGNVSSEAARRLALGLGASGLLLALWLGRVATGGAAAALVLTVWYTRRLKAYPLVGPLLVGALTATALGYGGLVAGNLVATFWPMAGLGLVFAGREVVKTMYDVAGDRTVGLRTTAVAWGHAGAMRAATILFGAGTACVVYAGLPWLQTDPTAWLTLGTVLGLFFVPLVPLWRAPTDRDVCGRFLVTSKLVGLGTLVAVLIVTHG